MYVQNVIIYVLSIIISLVPDRTLIIGPSDNIDQQKCREYQINEQSCEIYLLRTVNS